MADRANRDGNFVPTLTAVDDISGQPSDILSNSRALYVYLAGALATLTVDGVAKLDAYKTNNIDDGDTATDVTYLGKVKDDGTYCIQKIDETSATLPVFTYATIANNALVTTYASAWSGRASLTYGVYQTAF